MELDHAPFAPFMSKRTAAPPGVAPLKFTDWLHRDAAYAAQMAYRDRLLAEARDVVFDCRAQARAAAEELLEKVVEFNLGYGDFSVADGAATRADGVAVDLASDHPLIVAARLAQEDFCILQKPAGGGEHVLTGAALCFPSRWSLAEKMGRPLIGVHESVPNYDGDLARRVQRMFDALRPGMGLARANWLVHTMPELHQPLTDAAKRAREKAQTGRFWLRVERQCLMALERTGAAVFSIKTCVTPIEALSADQRAGLATELAETSAPMQAYHGGADHHRAAIAALRAV